MSLLRHYKIILKKYTIKKYLVSIRIIIDLILPVLRIKLIRYDIMLV